MLNSITTLAPHGLPMAGPSEGVAPVSGPLVVLAFTLQLGGPVANEIQPPAPQSCQNSCPNVALQVQVVDQNGNPVDVSTANALEFFLLAPDGVPQQVAASLLSNGLDGMLQYVTTDEDLEVVGVWQIQAQLTFGSEVLRTRWAPFGVDANIGDLLP